MRSSTPSRPSADQRPCSPISPATPTVSPSRTAAWSAATAKASSVKYKDYRRKGRERYKTLPLAVPEFIRRFLLHVLPSGFHRIRHYGLFANGGRTRNISLARELLAMPAPESEADDAASDDDTESPSLSEPCQQCDRRHRLSEQVGDLRYPASRPSAETMLTIAADPTASRPGPRSASPTRASNNAGARRSPDGHHPAHRNMIVPGGGISPDE